MLSAKEILTLPLIFLLLLHLAQGTAVRKVVYHDGVIEMESEDTSLSSSLEDIPPREMWFRVREGSVPQRRPKAVNSGARDIVALPATRNPPSSTGTLPRSEEDDGQVQVFVRNRGRIGFQNNRAAERHDQEDEYEHRPEGRADGDVSELSKLPSSVSGRRQENWYQHIRHVPGHRNREIATEWTNEDSIVPEKPSFSTRQTQSHEKDIQSYDNDDDLVVVGGGDRETETQTNYGNLPRIISTSDNRDTEDISPPPHDQVAKMARYIVHHSNWTSVATISTLSPLRGFPFVNVFSLSDGPANNSSGVPYMYLTPLDMSVNDLKNNSKASMTMSLAQTEYCKQQKYDPEDPRCAHVILSGNIVPVATTSDEIQFAQRALYSRHPDMEDWPKDHGWFFAKLEVAHIIVLDYFGGAKTVSPDDYFKQSVL